MNPHQFDGLDLWKQIPHTKGGKPMNKIDQQMYSKGIRSLVRVDPLSIDLNDLYLPTEVFTRLCKRFGTNRITFTIRPFFDMSPEMAESHPPQIMLLEEG